MQNKYIATVMMTACCLGATAQTTAIMKGEFRPGEVLVKFKSESNVRAKAPARGKGPSSNNAAINQILIDLGAEEMAPLMPLTGGTISKAKARGNDGEEVKDADLSGLYLVSYDKSKDVNVAISALSTLEEVEFAEPNYIVHTQAVEDWGTQDPMYSQQWGVGYSKIPQMWKSSAAEKDYLSRRPVIAILDTGVDISHPDLADNIWTNDQETEDGRDDDGNGFKDDLHGWDFVNQTGIIGDYNGHGTHCAGIAAAVGGNGKGIVGANPEAYIMPVTVMQSNGSGDVATIIKGIDYAYANGADVISMSFGGYAYSIAEDQALSKAYHKCVLVAAAGNDGLCVTDTHIHFPAPRPAYPAAFTYVLGVQAWDPAWNSLACFSNYDDDGPIYSEYNDEKLYNYELIAPGVDILSTYPGGRYKIMSGTSMACPLVAGIASRMLQKKDILSTEMLFGDLVQTSIVVNNDVARSIPVDAEKAFNISEKDRKPNLHLVTVAYNDSLGDCDGRLDAGEIVDIYPTLRNDWGTTFGGVTITLAVADNEDPTICEFLTNDVALGCDLSGYAKVKSQNPIRIKLRENITDGRIVRLQVIAKCDNMSEDYRPDVFTFKVENGVELGGTQREDITLYPGIQYIVSRNWGIPKDRKVTIKPGTTIKIKDNVGISNYGHMLFEGTRDSMITITKGDLDQGYIGGFLNDNANYIDFKYVVFDNLTNITFDGHRYENCVIRNCVTPFPPYKAMTTSATFKGCDIYNNQSDIYFSSGSTFIETSIHDNVFGEGFGSCARFYHSNYIGNEIVYGISSPDVRSLEASNCYGNYYDFKLNPDPTYVPGFYSLIFYTTEPEIFYLSDAYLGTASQKVALESILDTEDNVGWGTVDVWQMKDCADRTAPVCVDYVLFDGKDPLDDADEMSPIGVGTHTIEVHFNRAMNQDVEPFITMGVRPPYTQNAINEEGRWTAPDTYEAKITITGRTSTDGTNRIRIAGYKQKDQNPEFSSPIEKYRYNILVSAAGSMSTGMMAEPGLGKVTLNWETDEEDFDDLQGYNLYRFTMDENCTSSDSVMINRQLIESEETEFVDYDVVPGTTYYYYIKEIGTDLVEHFVSKTVAATPLTSIKGDANGSMKVDIADVMTVVAHLSGENPQPFIFEAADVNEDGKVDILDVVGILRIILAPDADTADFEEEEVANYYVKDGKLFISTPVAIGGIQINADAEKASGLSAATSLKDFEQMSAQINDAKQIFLAYSMTGAVLPAGDYEIASLDEEVDINSLVLCTPRGANIRVQPVEPNGISEIIDSDMAPRRGIFDLMGRRLQSVPDHGVVIMDGKLISL